jgi:DNA-binding NarL/FixJ family response regulator
VEVGAESSEKMTSSILKRWNDLTPTEGEVAWLIRCGYHDTEIAAKLFLAPDEIRNHLQLVYKKLGVSDPLELALYIVRHDLRGPGPHRSEKPEGTDEATELTG